MQYVLCREHESRAGVMGLGWAVARDTVGASGRVGIGRLVWTECTADCARACL